LLRLAKERCDVLKQLEDEGDTEVLVELQELLDSFEEIKSSFESCANMVQQHRPLYGAGH
jgi:hypothetical protein